VSCFCAEIQLSGKIPENIAKILFYQKTHGARRRDEGGLWPGLTTRSLDPSFRLYIPSDLIGAGVGRFSQIDFRCAAAIRNRDSEPETPFWHLAGMGI
jgi:hypothetical protein